MHIENLRIQNFRLFQEVIFNPTKRINLITGQNGAGKTSLLESIYILARNRSFRSNNNSCLINKNAREIIISANLIKDMGETFHIGLKKDTNRTELRVAGQKQKRISDLARMMPMGIITANIQKLIMEGPRSRRKFLNWGVFHVEHNYAVLMANYNKILIQRNAALRNGQKSYRAWDSQLIQFGNEIDQKRKKYLQDFQKEYSELVNDYEVLNEVRIKYKQGWNQNMDLATAIADRDDQFIQYTYAGPHRSDLGIYLGNNVVTDFLSSGQLKILAILLIMAQLKLIKKITNETPILLFDDFQSEIDNHNKKSIFHTIENLDSQTFITSIELDRFFEERFNGQLFHVEHGEIL